MSNSIEIFIQARTLKSSPRTPKSNNFRPLLNRRPIKRHEKAAGSWGSNARKHARSSGRSRHDISQPHRVLPFIQRENPTPVGSWKSHLGFRGVLARNFSWKNGERGSGNQRRESARRSVWIRVRVFGGWGWGEEEILKACVYSRVRSVFPRAVEERKRRGGKNATGNTLDFRSSPINDPRLEFTDSWNRALLPSLPPSSRAIVVSCASSSAYFRGSAVSPVDFWNF